MPERPVSRVAAHKIDDLPGQEPELLAAESKLRCYGLTRYVFPGKDTPYRWLFPKPKRSQ